MNILYITHYTKLYGANKSLLRMMDQMMLKGIHPFVIFPSGIDGDLVEEINARGIRYASFSYSEWMHIEKKV